MAIFWFILSDCFIYPLFEDYRKNGLNLKTNKIVEIFRYLLFAAVFIFAPYSSPFLSEITLSTFLVLVVLIFGASIFSNILRLLTVKKIDKKEVKHFLFTITITDFISFILIFLMFYLMSHLFISFLVPFAMSVGN
jgi:predicted MFS family arabinose efflux permease